MVENEVLYSSYNCDNAVETFNIGFGYLKDEDSIAVFYTVIATGVEYPLVKTTNYTVDTTTDQITTVTGTISGLGSVSSPYASGIKITIKPDVEYTQETDIVSNSNYDPEVLETAYDKSVILAKQNKEQTDRSIKLQDSDAGTEMILPPLVDLTNGVLGFDASGQPQAHPGFIPRAYDSTYAYATDDIIQYTGKFFIALQATTGNTPTGGTADVYWKMLNFDGINYDTTIYFMSDDIVEYGGIMFRSLQDDNINHTPTQIDPDLWWEQLRIDLTYAPTINFMTDEHCEYSGYLFKSAGDNNKGNTPTAPAGDSNWVRVFTKGDPGEINPWDSGTTYVIDEVVTSSGIMYICILGNLNQTPPNATYWKAWPSEVLTKLVEMGGWDMDTAGTHEVDHGLSLAKIIGVRAWVQSDSLAAKHNLEIQESLGVSIRGGIALTTTKVVLTRDSYFDNATYSSTLINRGWIIIDYVV